MARAGRGGAGKGRGGEGGGQGAAAAVAAQRVQARAGHPALQLLCPLFCCLLLLLDQPEEGNRGNWVSGRSRQWDRESGGPRARKAWWDKGNSGEGAMTSEGFGGFLKDSRAQGESRSPDSLRKSLQD